MHRLIALITVCFVLTGIAPAVAEWDVDHLEELIPHAESDLERERYHAREGQLELLKLVEVRPLLLLMDQKLFFICISSVV